MYSTAEPDPDRGDPAFERNVNEAESVQTTGFEAEAMYHNLLELLPDTVVFTDIRGRLLYVNEAGMRLLGGDAGLIGQSLWDFVHPEGRASAQERSRRLLRGERLDLVEETLVSRDGRELYVESSSIPMQYRGRPAILTTIRDVTARKKAHEEVDRRERRFQEIADTAPVLIGMSESDGSFSFFNESWLTFSGATDENLLEGQWWNDIHPHDREPFILVYHAALDRREPFTVEWRMRRSDGRYRWLLGTAVPRYGASGSFSGYIWSCVDITERKEGEIELLGARNRAEEMARLKSAVLTNVTHEVRTPLTVILGFTSMLRQGVRPEYKRFVHVIERSGKRLLLMLDSILDLAQLEAGALEVDEAPFDINDAVHNAAEAARPLIEEKGLTLEVRFAEERVTAQQGHRILSRVLDYLLDNAVKFTDRGSVELAVEPEKDHVRIVVRDTGVGIDPAFLPRVFEEFSQESTGLERTYQGSGIGLTVSRRLLERLGGDIQVTSRKGEGSEFAIIYPAVAGRSERSVQQPSIHV